MKTQRREASLEYQRENHTYIYTETDPAHTIERERKFSKPHYFISRWLAPRRHATPHLRKNNSCTSDTVFAWVRKPLRLLDMAFNNSSVRKHLACSGVAGRGVAGRGGAGRGVAWRGGAGRGVRSARSPKCTPLWP